eukprot:TRINITY_DN15143_c0_g1::TRINITY_DN15143_c0_g1_i1::g.30583::m.30583 TRINITY_DN15143_c0_g1::TRINITY_DN15143_c0_g1_i1::g.30583  ORF type:complete len:470 (+),score=80.87,sp/Q8RX88/FACE1_ARATH/54.33/4e-154,Peptidase_M48/PF01435.13/3e-52,DUF955/PF06114.8/6.5e+03,DUF955/PF06114.8/0.024,DUF955/PF06114.8/6.2e+02,SprT-like/PF10263.4/0.064,DUF4538/PF15061.1/3.1e+03,DUF4538/PF15061.1/0.049,Peptidase_M56/PF05569.6/1.5e+03,Peptidase_M56/PF05569.6/0.19,Peptidase_M43/PF05572.8/0.22,DUF3671/PF12420.3/0.75,DUF367
MTQVQADFLTQYLGNDFSFLYASVYFMVFMYLFETYLDYRQHQKYKIKVKPSALNEIVSDEKFLKAQDYGHDKSRFGFVHSLFSQVESVSVLLFGGLPFLWVASLQILNYFGYDESYEILRSIVFTLCYSLWETLIGIPWSIYSTFVIEEKYGFNKQTLGLFFVDLVKQILLLFAMMPPILSGLIYILKWGGPLFHVYAWLFTLGITLVMMTIYPVLIAPLFNKFDPLPEGSLRTKIEHLAASLQFPLTKLFVVDGSRRSGHSNAYMYGFFKNKRIVLYDTLIQQSTEDEVVAVLAHELGHWKLNHTMISFFITQVILFSNFFLFGEIRNSDAIYHSFGFATKDNDRPIIIALILFQLLISPIDHCLGFMMNLVSRRFEFQADAFANKLGYCSLLKSGLVKLQQENLSTMIPDPWYSTYHHSHPPLVERLGALAVDLNESKKTQ